MDTSTKNTTGPQWFHEEKISIRFDARPILAGGGHPLGDVMQQLTTLNPGDIMLLITPFQPIPLIDKVKEQGFEVYSTVTDGLNHNYFCKIF
jgi:uncharacterized protein (DUF2249 family)